MPRKGGGRDGHGTGQQTSTRKAKNAGRNKRGDDARAEAAASALRAATKDADAGAGSGAGAGGEPDVSVISEEVFLDAFDQLSSKRWVLGGTCVHRPTLQDPSPPRPPRTPLCLSTGAV